ncbi:MAG: RodZ domain-containing protein [Candidatus Saccharibacteria bacterium]
MAKALFKTKPIKIDTLGEFLADSRKRLNYDIKTASLLTQIKPVYLESLERGKWNELPADVYVRGFLKNLSGLYQVEERLLLDQYEKEHGFEPKAEKRKQPEVRAVLTPKTIIITVTVLLSFLAIGYVVSQISSVLSPPKLSLAEPVSDLTVKGNSLMVSGNAEIGADVMINGQAVLSDKNGDFSENLALSPGLNVVEVSVKNKFNKVSTVVRRINADIPEAQPPAEALPVNVTVEVGPGSAWIYMEADGVVVARGTMLPGSSKSVSAKDEILLTSSDAGSTKVQYNGKDMGTLGRSGEVIRNVEFTSQK